jgi:hypothetical protein
MILVAGHYDGSAVAAFLANWLKISFKEQKMPKNNKNL